jgi:hypothetical protein
MSYDIYRLFTSTQKQRQRHMTDKGGENTGKADQRRYCCLEIPDLPVAA